MLIERRGKDRGVVESIVVTESKKQISKTFNKTKQEFLAQAQHVAQHQSFSLVVGVGVGYTTVWSGICEFIS